MMYTRIYLVFTLALIRLAAKPAAPSDHTTLNYTSPDILQEDLTKALEKRYSYSTGGY